MVELDDPSASLYVLNEEHVAVLVASTTQESEQTGRICAGEELVLSFAFDNVLAPGRYSPLLTIAHRGTGLDIMDRFEGSFTFMVTGVQPLGGLIDLPVEVGVSRNPAESAPRVEA